MLKAKGNTCGVKYQAGLSLRDIGGACNCGKSTVSELLKRAEAAQITWPIELTDKQLMSALYPPVKRMGSPARTRPGIHLSRNEEKERDLATALGRVQEQHPDGIMYTQFAIGTASSRN